MRPQSTPHEVDELGEQRVEEGEHIERLLDEEEDSGRQLLEDSLEEGEQGDEEDDDEDDDEEEEEGEHDWDSDEDSDDSQNPEEEGEQLDELGPEDSHGTDSLDDWQGGFTEPSQGTRLFWQIKYFLS